MVECMDTTKVTVNLPTSLVTAARAKAAQRRSTFTAELEHALRSQLLADDLQRLAEFQTPEDVVHDAQDAFDVAESRRGSSAA
jgi:hypothetical protein